MKVRVPADLTPFRGEHVVKALGTSNLSEAKRLHPHTVAEIERGFEELRSQLKGQDRVRLALQAGRLYAKTTGRIRFEIAHDLQNLAPARYIAHSRLDDADLFGRFDMLAADAADEVNAVLERLDRLSFFPPGSLKPYHLVRRISDALPDRTASDAALSLIVNNRAIRLAPGDPLRPIVEALLRFEVLVRSDRTTFVVAPLFRQAVAELRGQARAHPGHLSPPP